MHSLNQKMECLLLYQQFKNDAVNLSLLHAGAIAGRYRKEKDTTARCCLMVSRVIGLIRMNQGVSSWHVSICQALFTVEAVSRGESLLSMSQHFCGAMSNFFFFFFLFFHFLSSVVELLSWSHPTVHGRWWAWMR